MAWWVAGEIGAMREHGEGTASGISFAGLLTVGEVYGGPRAAGP